MEKRGAPALLAEFIGTLALVFTIIMVVAMYALQSDVARGFTFPFIALAHGLILLLMIQALGPISGAHFNPAVSVSLAAVKKISWPDAALYVLVQVAGAVAAALLAKALISDQAETVKFAANAFNDSEVNLAAAAVLEGIATFFLVWAVVGVATNPDASNDWAPLTIAGTLALGVLLIAPLTGAGINPARSFGPALVANEWAGGVGNFLVAYVIGPMVGGLAAALTYTSLFIRRGETETAR